MSTLLKKDEEYLMGIDEAGRGPVLGPMVYGACFIPLSKYEEFKKIGFADSKQLTENERNKLFNELQQTDWIEWLCDIIPANYLSTRMLEKNKYSLNEISHESAMDLIKYALKRKFNVKQVFLDTVGTAASYENKLKLHFMGQNNDIQFVVSEKADSIYPIVSAASIVAKVSRDRILRTFIFDELHLKNDSDQICKSLGNGYPSDELTKQWLKDNINNIFGFPSIVRFSWQTAQTIIDKQCVPVTWSDEKVHGNSVLSSFGFAAGNKNITSSKRSPYFIKRKLNLCFQNPF